MVEARRNGRAPAPNGYTMSHTYRVYFLFYRVLLYTQAFDSPLGGADIVCGTDFSFLLNTGSFRIPDMYRDNLSDMLCTSA